MKVIILGTGTSQGVPVIGCRCETCNSKNPKDKRTRTSAIINVNNSNILIDTSVDFRQQMLSNNLNDIDSVLYTHHHVDHIFGMDDLRQITQRFDKKIDIYGRKDTLDELRITFRYVFDKQLIRHNSVPIVKFHDKSNRKFRSGVTEIMPIEVHHGNIKIFGYRINDFAYITDASAIDEKELAKLKGLKVLVLNALRIRPHPTHFNLQQAIEISKSVNPEKTYLTHLTHDLIHDKINQTLPKGIELAYDGLEIDL
ncbi:MAG: MBL fold metallo-hydrolase [Ignavibacteria bacterium]|nr:MBL fold metallo-hydrolase [Ignavibacteria bacterium]